MFKSIDFFDKFISFFYTPWWLYLLMGLNFILLAVLIVVYPQLLAYLVAGFLLFNGMLLIGLAFQYRSLDKKYKKWKNSYWIEVD